MTDQLDIDGNVGPVSWDGEPLFCDETVAEGLFDVSAFGQLRGQTFLDCQAEQDEIRVEAESGGGLDAQIRRAARLGGSRQVNIRIVDGKVVSA